MALPTDPETGGLNAEPPPPAYGASYGIAGSPTSEETAPPPYDESNKGRTLTVWTFSTDFSYGCSLYI